jgi:hypothetical protein
MNWCTHISLWIRIRVCLSPHIHYGMDNVYISLVLLYVSFNRVIWKFLLIIYDVSTSCCTGMKWDVQVCKYYQSITHIVSDCFTPKNFPIKWESKYIQRVTSISMPLPQTFVSEPFYTSDRTLQPGRSVIPTVVMLNRACCCWTMDKETAELTNKLLLQSHVYHNTRQFMHVIAVS